MKIVQTTLCKILIHLQSNFLHIDDNNNLIIYYRKKIIILHIKNSLNEKCATDNRIILSTHYVSIITHVNIMHKDVKYLKIIPLIFHYICYTKNSLHVHTVNNIYGIISFFVYLTIYGATVRRCGIYIKNSLHVSCYTQHSIVSSCAG